MLTEAWCIMAQMPREAGRRCSRDAWRAMERSGMTSRDAWRAMERSGMTSRDAWASNGAERNDQPGCMGEQQALACDQPRLHRRAASFSLRPAPVA